jgi:hypothetical protein
MKRIIASLTVLLCLAAPAAYAYASASTYNPLSAACAAGTQASSACAKTSSNPISGPNGIIRKASLIIATIAGVAAVIIIIVSGFQYITSAGDPQKAASARNGIIGAAVGLVIIAAAQTILIFVLDKI